MPEECKHEWKEEYYGTRCVKCDAFYPSGCAPWDEGDYDDDFDFAGRYLCLECGAAVPRMPGREWSNHRREGSHMHNRAFKAEQVNDRLRKVIKNNWSVGTSPVPDLTGKFVRCERGISWPDCIRGSEDTEDDAIDAALASVQPEEKG
jgi:hypothetical protein